jgi:DNA-binding transcriptional ArsR family regulator
MSTGGQAERFPEPTVKELVTVFQQLADPTRLRILVALLEHGELSVTALADRFSLMQPTVSHNLKWLRMSGLVQCCRAGRFVLYRIDSPELANLIERGFTLAAGGTTLNCRDFSLTFKRHPSRGQSR